MSNKKPTYYRIQVFLGYFSRNDKQRRRYSLSTSIALAVLYKKEIILGYLDRCQQQIPLKIVQGAHLIVF